MFMDRLLGINMKFLKFFMFLSLFQWYLSFVNLGIAAESIPNIFKGQPFSNPDELNDQPESWRQQTIRYRDQDQGVEIALLLDQNIYPGLLPLVEKFAKEQKIKVVVREGTCGPAAEGVFKKEIDVGGSCCPTAKVDRLPGLRWHTVGISPLAILANRADPVEQLTAEQVREIFRGKVTRWAQIPGLEEKFSKDVLIRPVTRLHCKTRPGHWRLILDNEEMFGPRINEVGTIIDMVIGVGNNRGSLGYVENWHVLNDPKMKDLVKTIKINQQDPSDVEAVSSGKYPFYWVYNVSTWSDSHLANPKAQQLVQYLIDHADAVDPNLHLIPASVLRKHGWKFNGDEVVGEP